MIFFSASRALHSECTAFTFVFIINFPNIWNTTLLHHRRHTLSSYFIIYTHTHINCRMIQQFRQHRQRLASTRSPNCILMKISTRKMNWLQPRAGPQQVLWKAKESHCTAVSAAACRPPHLLLLWAKRSSNTVQVEESHSCSWAATRCLFSISSTCSLCADPADYYRWFFHCSLVKIKRFTQKMRNEALLCNLQFAAYRLLCVLCWCKSWQCLLPTW